MDVIYRQPHLPGVPEFIQWLKRKRRNTYSHQQQLHPLELQRSGRMGLEVPERFYTSALATALPGEQAPGCSAYVIGEQAC